ncbi:D-amino acid dehydrogenase [Shinella oryzae]|uniref:D-amino acid dehydrogenase n=1 Tax=Shinella oryzae TaxID=2871820 RepID=UPI001FF553BA|nr:D-amino acid dehydrogenase [Shinella oryzae]UPA27228.1 D-amino acid dehydrogenase [Shinella oryzae]
MKHIAVIGAGITGVTTAYALLQRGFDVTLVERNKYAGMETSYANGGQLSACNAEVWTNFGTVLKGLKWMLRRDAPLLVNPSPSWQKYGWFTKFLFSIPAYESNTVRTVEIALAARRHMFEIAEAEQIDFDLVQRGILHVYDDAASFAAATAVNKLLTRGGLERRRVSPAEISLLEPALSGDFHGGYYTESDYTGDIHKFTRGLAAACGRLGASFQYERDVTALDMKSGVRLMTCNPAGRDPGDLLADGVVICAGVESRRLARLAGESVDIYPVKGYSITVNLDTSEAQSSAPWVSLLDEAAKIVTSRLGPSRLRVAGTAEFNGYNLDIRRDRIKPLVDWTARRFPGVPTNSVIPWAGLRPMMPNMMPRVGRGRRRQVFYNTGHGHLGWTLSCATAQTIADVVASGD